MRNAAAAALEHVDVLIVGAGLSGIGAACHLQKQCPGRSYAIVEARAAMGGTWDLFRYPGIRSDSDMYTLGYAFKPWEQSKAIADGPSILQYVQDTAREHGVDRHIRYGHKVLGAAWSTSDARWTVTLERSTDAGPERLQLSCNFLFSCAGYYRYDEGYTPDFEGREDFKGRIVHPQHWPKDLDYAGKRVVVIGSGATAVTLIPELAKDAAQVTMLQRSPTYMVSRPSEDGLANAMRRVLPARWAYALTRWRRVLLGMYVYRLSRRNPGKLKGLLLQGVRMWLGPDYDVDKHFTPRYNPWDQRLCLVPDGDLFRALRANKARVVTDHIDRFTAGGIRLRSGEELAADIIVTATGLNLQVLGGLALTVDGQAVDLGQALTYKGLMYNGVPNLAACTGYTNASWTLKCDLSCDYVCRLLNHMARHNLQYCMPRNDDPTVQEQPWVDFSSGYIQRTRHLFPKQGNKAPWKLYQNYARDILLLRHGRLEDGVMRFARAAQASPA
jgi:cation diffusion facilitator CzcD-associated flavoprotein CzcO